MNVYQEEPNIVTVMITDRTGDAQRFVVGKTLDEVIALVDPAQLVKRTRQYKRRAAVESAGTDSPEVSPLRRKRRTKAEMAAAAATTEPTKDKAWA